MPGSTAGKMPAATEFFNGLRDFEIVDAFPDGNYGVTSR